MLLVNMFSLIGIMNPLNAHANRYGMKQKESNGVFQLVDKNKICKTVKDSCLNLPKDIYKPWIGYSPKLIQEEDYANCTTKKYIFGKC